MNFLKKIQKLDIFWKKFIIVVVLVLVGIPLGFLVEKNFRKRIEEVKKREFLKRLNPPEIKSSFKGLKETREEIEKEFEKIEGTLNKISTSTPSTTNQ